MARLRARSKSVMSSALPPLREYVSAPNLFVRTSARRSPGLRKDVPGLAAQIAQVDVERFRRFGGEDILRAPGLTRIGRHPRGAPTHRRAFRNRRDASARTPRRRARSAFRCRRRCAAGLFRSAGAGENCISPRPRSIRPVTPSPLITWNTEPVCSVNSHVLRANRELARDELRRRNRGAADTGPARTSGA